MILKNALQWIGMVSVFAFSGASVAASEQAVASDKSNKKVVESIQHHFPEVDLKNIKPSPIGGLFEVTRGPSVIYITQDGRYAISGDIIDIQKNFENITEEARQKARIDALNALNPEQIITFTPKDPKYTVTVFTDIECSYCRKFHDDIQKYNDLGIAVRYLAFPREGLQSEGYQKAVKVWCAKDKKQALALAEKDKNPGDNKCENHQVDDQFKLGVMMGIHGTPSIVLENGMIIPGYLTPNKLLEVLQKIEQAEKDEISKKEATPPQKGNTDKKS